ncbi:hypothetical protein ABZ619_39015 [Streptomyces sp. NPDC007851]|uniref:hypothetical protein n=1 Tax=Streptomyces sp. NPDC007851 TaxID=3155008 RepID=UPI003404749B
MKNYSFTTRNVIAGERNGEGVMVLRTLGDVTLTLEGMLPNELADWEWPAAALNTRGWDEEQFLLTVRGWKVVHPEAGVVGILLQGAGTRVHVEWYDAVNGDFFAAGWVSGLGQTGLRHGAAAIVNARQQAGQGLPVDVEPEPYQAPAAPAASAASGGLPEGTRVRYTGTFAATFGDLGISEFLVYGCDCDNRGCRNRYELRIHLWDAPGFGPVTEVAAQHVHPDHVTVLDAERAAV